MTDLVYAATNEVKKFCRIMAVACVVIGTIILARHHHGYAAWYGIAAAFFCAGVFFPRLAAPLYYVWMRLAFVLGWINTRVILIVVFYVIFAPIGLVLRALGKDLLDRHIERNSDSYWQAKNDGASDPSRYERQF